MPSGTILLASCQKCDWKFGNQLIKKRIYYNMVPSVTHWIKILYIITMFNKNLWGMKNQNQ